MRALVASSLLVSASLACGGQVARRPMILDVEGISGIAQRLVVSMYAGDDDRACADITPENVRQMSASRTMSWTRGDDAERAFLFEDVDEPEVSLVVYTEDAGGAVVQFICRRVTYADLESPQLSIELPRVE